MPSAAIALLIAFDFCSATPMMMLRLPDATMCQRVLNAVKADEPHFSSGYGAAQWVCVEGGDEGRAIEAMRERASTWACQ